MKLTKRGNFYLWEGDYNSRLLPKAAGFRWNPDSSSNTFNEDVPQKTWWTDDAGRASALAEYADDTCKDDLTKIHIHRTESLTESRAVDAILSIPAPEGLDYYGFQKAGIAYALKRTATLIGDDMGLGKTIQGIGIINFLDEIRSVLVVCPATAKRAVWEKELRKWLIRDLSIGVADSKTWPETDIVVINYDILGKHHDKITAREFDLLIVDEFHYVKNPKSIRSQEVNEIQAKRFTYMSGTPIVNRPIELWPIIHKLDPITWNSFWYYAKRYCSTNFNIRPLDFKGATNLEELQEKLRSTIMIRRLKSEVLTDLPPKIRQVIELPSTGLTRFLKDEEDGVARNEERIAILKAAIELAKASDDPEDYREAVRNLQKGIRAGFGEISELRHKTALAKLPYVIDHLTEALETGRKVVVFAWHHDVVEEIKKAFPEITVVLTGDTPMDTATRTPRKDLIERFQTDSTIKLFIGSITAAGVAITLTAASHVIFAELDWVPGNMTQAEDRTHRIGQTDSVFVQHLVLEGSLDANMARTLVEKQGNIERALDKKLPPSEIERLKEEMEEPILPTKYESTSRRAIEQEAALLSPEQIKAIHQALQLLAAFDPDGAQILNTVGFNRIDTQIGHDLASRRYLTPKQAALGKKIITKYKRQISKEIYTLIFGEENAQR